MAGHFMNQEVFDFSAYLEVHQDIDENFKGIAEADSNKDIKFVTKSGIKWNSIPPSPPRHNAIIQEPGLINGSTMPTSVAEMFSLFITKEIVEEICIQTNVHLVRKGKKFNPITVEEIYAFIGVLLASGRNGPQRSNLSELWTSEDPFCQPFFTAALSRDRFSLIYFNIQFDDKETRDERFKASGNQLEVIDNVFNKFVDGCKRNYSPGSNITVDERLAPFRGKCPFKVCMLNKPGRYGIRIWTSADSLTAYILNLKIYTGAENKQKDVDEAERAVMEMVQPHFETNRGVSTGDFCISVRLADALLEKNLTLTGTIGKTDEVPETFTMTKSRPLYSSLFGFTNNMTLISYVPKEHKVRLLLTTQFHNAKLSPIETREPEILIYYNQTKGAVDKGCKITRENSCVRGTQSWPVRIFMEMLDIAVLNSYLLWSEKYPDGKKSDRSSRRTFIAKLSLELAKPNIMLRKNVSTKIHNKLHRAFHTVISYYNQTNDTGSSIAEEETMPHITTGQPPVQARGCRFCPHHSRKRTRLLCGTCANPVCASHRIEKKIMTCLDCVKRNYVENKI